MYLRIRLAVAAVLSIAPCTLLAQNNAVVVFDATHMTTVCVNPDITHLSPGNCKGFLVQGQRNQLRVINRKFLTNYTFFIDKVTVVQNFAIESLEEAANLVTPLSSAVSSAVSKGAAPKGLATTGALTLRTAQDLMAELLNPATSSNPANEIASDWLIVKREAASVRTDAKGFRTMWANLVREPVGERCLPAYGAPTLKSARACLDWLNRQQRAGSFQTAPFRNEDEFRKLIVRDNDAIAMVNLLGSVLTQQTPLLTSQLSAFDGDLALLRADMNTLAGNVQAIQDAVNLLESITSGMTKAQIKARLIQTLNGGSKPVLDDAELNRLTDEYYSFTRSAAAKQALNRARSAIELVWLEGRAQAKQELAFARALTPHIPVETACNFAAHGAELGCLADYVGARYSFLLGRSHTHLSQDLPILVAEINIKQSELLARTNEIYDNSSVSEPLDKAIDLSGNKGNLRVYFTIYETALFPRYAIPTSVTATSPAISASPAVVTAPAAPVTSTATTTSTTSTATSVTPTPAQPSGIPVMSGMIEVHDQYRATLVAGFAFSTVKETSISTNNTISTGTTTGTNPVACTSTATCTQVTVSSGPAHSSVIVGLSYHPWGYDTFPGAFSWTKPSVALKQGIGIFGGLSVQNLNDYYAGADLQIAHGVQIMGGMNFYRQNTLAPGFVSGGIYVGQQSFTGPQRWSRGGFFGIGLNLSIFRKAFGSVTGLGTNTTSTGT